MGQFQSGNVDAFQEIFDRYSARLINFAYRLLNSREEAEDIAQQVFLRIYRRKESYKASRPFRPWIFSITSRLISNRLRDRTRQRTLSLDSLQHAEYQGSPAGFPDAPSALPEESLESKQVAAAVRQALEELPESQRNVVLLAKFEGMSYDEIAQTLNLSLPSVKSLLFRARLALKKSLSTTLRSDKDLQKNKQPS